METTRVDGVKAPQDAEPLTLAIIVFPVPGGPYINTPRGGSIPICLYNSNCVRGSSTASRISCFWTSNPPISLYDTFGFSSMSCTVESDSGGNTSTTL